MRSTVAILKSSLICDIRPRNNNKAIGETALAAIAKLNQSFRSCKSVVANVRASIWTETVRRAFAWAVFAGSAVFIVAGILITVAPVALGWFLVWESRSVDEVPQIESIVYLDQGESWEEYRAAFYETPQGAPIENIRYRWFIELERPLSRKKFVTPDYMEAVGFLMDASYHPRLPVGITKRLDPVLNEEVIDITCAACHTGQISVNVGGGEYVGLRVDGGQAMHAFTSIEQGHFGKALLTSMIATYSNPFKFDRFARNVICGELSGECDEYKSGNAKAQLRRSLAESLGRVANKGLPELTRHLYPTHEGFGRVDALARIGNRVMAERIDPYENYKEGNAPVNYPQLWDIWKLDRVQFTGSVRQALARNVGQALGTGANFQFVGAFGAELDEQELSRTSIEMENIVALEEWLMHLEAPRWPADKLSQLEEWQIDSDRALAGRELFVENCAGCHGPNRASEAQRRVEVPLKTANDDHWRVVVLPAEVIGTDPNSTLNFMNNRYDMRRIGLHVELVRNLVRPIWVEQMAREIRDEYEPTFMGSWSEHECPNFSDVSCPSDEVIKADIARLSNVEARTKSLARLAAINEDLDAIDLGSVTLGEALNYLGILVRDRYWQQSKFTEDWQKIRGMEGFGALDIPIVDGGYKARPLSGVWATAPYLHNGSVPTIYQLLSPDEDDSGVADKRCDTFEVGLRGYDPVNLGLPVVGEACEAPHELPAEEFDTSLDGNANTGHWFRRSYTGRANEGVIGRELSPDERLEIIEFLKCLRDDREDRMDPACLEAS